MERHVLRSAVVLVGILLAGSMLQAQEKVTTKETYIEKTTLVEKVSGGEIDWGSGMYYATGEGLMPSATEEPNRAKAFLKAKGYARMQAIAHLLQVVEGTTISYEATGKDYIAQDETLRQKIEGFVRGVEILDTRRATLEGQSVVRVTVGTKMYGGGGNPGTLLLARLREKREEADKPVRVELAKAPVAPAAPVVAAEPPREVSAAKPSSPFLENPAPVTPKPSVSASVVVPAPVRTAPIDPPAPPVVLKAVTTPAAQAPVMLEKSEDSPVVAVPAPPPAPVALAPAVVAPVVESAEPYSSVIIDARGFKIARAMCPKIRRPDGSEVWGTVKVDADWVNEVGILGYAASMEMAQKSRRCGKNPLVIAAIGRAGGAAMCDAVVSAEDAARILAQNARGKFLDNFNVLFLVDAK